MDELTERGLTTRPTASRPAGPVSVNKIHQMLTDSYYVGIVSYKGEQFAGRHEPLIDEELFNAVQALVESRGRSGERRREHHHYLKGSVYCGECRRRFGVEQRLILQRAVGRNGGEYYYFFCPGRRERDCNQPHHNVLRVEYAVEDFYKTKRFGPDFIAAMRDLMTGTIADQSDAQRLLQRQLREQLKSYDVQEENLLDLAADPEVPQARIRARLSKIKLERERLSGQLGGVETDLKMGVRYIEANLRLLENPQELYVVAEDEVRRRLNQAIFHRLYISDEVVEGAELNEPLGQLLATEAAYRASDAGLGAEAIKAAYNAAFARNVPAKQKAAQEDGLLDSSQRMTTTWTYLITAASADGVSNKPPMVEMGELNPRPSLSLHVFSGRSS
ncbi:hypothetical protein GCM10025874_31840 [Arenivirga flava]|uniref:Recombinase domain-containing protein n=1 Tax=Arenivirga flava TaxID=1930060 RepID=A0AA37UTH0_9MICO|nr:hypothetical protein GCM10025874_31840 [Arenivirga flava]